MYKALQLLILFLFSVFLMASCTPSAPTSIPPVSDQEFEAAVHEAHDTMNIVRQALLAPKASYAFVGLKVRFRGEGIFEDIWTEPVDYYNGVFTTQLVEGVTIQIGLHPERLVRVPEKDVLDWMIIKDDGKLIGGYTIQLAYEHMTPDEKKEFIRITGYVME
jgi:uncharacterized protein YegJ (DUF2314 family)